MGHQDTRLTAADRARLKRARKRAGVVRGENAAQKAGREEDGSYTLPGGQVRDAETGLARPDVLHRKRPATAVTRRISRNYQDALRPPVRGEPAKDKARVAVQGRARDDFEALQYGNLPSGEFLKRVRASLKPAEQRDLGSYSDASSQRLQDRLNKQANRDTLRLFTQTVPEVVLGKNLAGLLPGGRPASESTVRGTAIDLALFAPGTVIGGPIRGGRAAVRAAKARPTRTFRTGALAIEIPAAKSRTGRVAESLLDKVLRPTLGKTPLVRDETEKAGAELGRRVDIKGKLETAPAKALRKMGKRLTLVEEYTLRVLAEGATIGERVALHQGQAAKKAGLERAFHDVHVDLLRGASRFVDESSGVPVLAAGAPQRLRRAWDLFQKVGASRQEILKDIGRLSDETILERVHAPGKVFKGARFRGEGFVGPGSDFQGGKQYVSYQRGVPGRRYSAYLKAAGQMFGGGGRRTIGPGPDDITLRKAFKGKTILSGRFRTDVAGATAEQLVKASRMSAARMARDEFRRAATDVPVRGDEIPIREDFLIGKPLPDSLRQVWENMDALEAGGRKMGLFELDGVEAATLEALNKWMFPEGAVPIANDVMQPIKGIKWVPRGLITESGLFTVPAASKMVKQSWGKLARAGGEGLGVIADVANLGMKAAVLYLNPAYGPVQFIQNGLRLISEEGPLALAKIPKAWKISRQLDEVEKAKINNLMQMDVLVRARSDRLLRRGVEPIAAVQTAIADLGPRWAAFLISAEKRGFTTAAELKQLLGNKDAFPQLEQITREALDTMGDFERMNPFEQQILSRVMWFWPWMHVAGRMTTRFPIDHPVQATVGGAAAYKAHEYADEKFGERPWYAETYFPVGDDVVNLGPLFPAATTATQAAAIANFLGLPVTGPKLGDTLTPAFGAAGEGAFGVDTFTGREVEGGFPAAMARNAKNVPIASRARDLLQSDEERAQANDRKLRPRSENQSRAQVVLGALAPTGYNREVGERLAEGNAPKSQQKRLAEALREERTNAKKLGLAAIPDEVKQAIRVKAAVEDRIASLERQQRKRDDTQVPPGKRFKLTAKQRAAAALSAFRDMVPDFDYAAAKADLDALPPDEIQGFSNSIRRDMYSGVLEEWHRDARG